MTLNVTLLLLAAAAAAGLLVAAAAVVLVVARGATAAAPPDPVDRITAAMEERFQDVTCREMNSGYRFRGERGGRRWWVTLWGHHEEVIHAQEIGVRPAEGPPLTGSIQQGRAAVEGWDRLEPTVWRQLAELSLDARWSRVKLGPKRLVLEPEDADLEGIPAALDAAIDALAPVAEAWETATLAEGPVPQASPRAPAVRTERTLCTYCGSLYFFTPESPACPGCGAPPVGTEGA